MDNNTILINENVKSDKVCVICYESLINVDIKYYYEWVLL